MGERDAGSRGLRVVDQHVDATELLDGGVDDCLHGRLVVGTGAHVGGDGKHLDAVGGLEPFLGVLELLHVAAGDDEVGALLGVCRGNAVADGAGLAVLERGETAARDDCGLTFQKTHNRPFARCAIDTLYRYGVGRCGQSPHSRLE